MSDDLGVPIGLSPKQKMKYFIRFLVIIAILVISFLIRVITGPEHDIHKEDYPVRIKLKGEVIDITENKKYTTLEIETKKFDDSINILVYSPLKEKLKGIEIGDILRTSAFKISINVIKNDNRCYEAKKIEIKKAKRNPLDEL